MSQSPEFMPLNPVAGIQLSRSLSANVDFVFHPPQMTGLSPGQFGPTPLPPLKSVKLLAESSADDNSIQNQLDCPPEGTDLWVALKFLGRLPKRLKPRPVIARGVDPDPVNALHQSGTNPEWIPLGPIILNPRLNRIKSVPPDIKKITVKTGELALNLSPNRSLKEALIHHHEYSSQPDKVPPQLFPKLAFEQSGISPDNLGQVPLKTQHRNRSFRAVNPGSIGKKTPIFLGN